MTSPLMAVLFLPIAAGACATLYPWADPEVVEATSRVARGTRRGYLNVDRSSLIRAAIYFAIWIGLAPGPQRRGRGARTGRGPGADAAGSRRSAARRWSLLLPDASRSPRSTGGCRSSRTGTRRSTASMLIVGQVLCDAWRS